MAEKYEKQKVLCRGGNNTSEDVLMLSSDFPGMATRLLNYEVSFKGGYRRIDGTSAYGTGATLPGTGATIGVWVFNETIYGARKLGLATGASYEVRRYVTAVGWETAATNVFSTGSTDVRTALGVDRLRVRRHNFTGTERAIIVDGINYPATHDGTTWSLINGSSDVLGAAYVRDFKNRMVFAGMPALSNKIVLTAPNTEDDFNTANGAIVINVGFTVKGLAVFRERLYVFGDEFIKRISGDDSSDFKLEDVTSSLGCAASDSIIEVGGDVLYLAYDGIRKISGTDKIGDVDLDTVTEAVRSNVVSILGQYNPANIVSVLVGAKTQFRYFFYNENLGVADSKGLIGGVRLYPDGQKAWEFGDLLGIQATCAASGFINGAEVVVHGAADGAVYRQENGDTSFNGADIISVYATPYLDQGDTETTKDYHRLHTFYRPEGAITRIYVGVNLAWDDPNYQLPSNYIAALFSRTAVFGDDDTLYDDSTILYDGFGRKSVAVNIGASAPSIKFTYVHISSVDKPFSIQGFVVKYINNETVT